MAYRGSFRSYVLAACRGGRVEDAKRHFAAAYAEARSPTTKSLWMLKVCKAPCRAGRRSVLEWLPNAEGWSDHWSDHYVDVILAKLLKYEHFELAGWFETFVRESGRRFGYYLPLSVFNQARVAGQVGVQKWLLARPGLAGPLPPWTTEAALETACAAGDTASVEWAASAQPPEESRARLRAQQERARKEGRWAMAETIRSVLAWSTAREAWAAAVIRSRVASTRGAEGGSGLNKLKPNAEAVSPAMETPPPFLVQVSAGRRPVFVVECDDSGTDRETFLGLVGSAGTTLQEMQVSPRDSFIVAAVWLSSKKVMLAEIDMMKVRQLPSSRSVLLAEVREALAGPPLVGGEPACRLAPTAWVVLRQDAGWFDARRKRLAEFFGAPVGLPE